jgi:hypothetical protein
MRKETHIHRSKGVSHLMRSGHKLAHPSDEDASLASMQVYGDGELSDTQPDSVEVDNTVAQQQGSESMMQKPSMQGQNTTGTDAVSSSESVIDQLSLGKKLLHTVKKLQSSTHLSLGFLLFGMLTCTVVTIKGFHKAVVTLFWLKGCKHDGAEVYEDQGLTLSVCKKCGQKKILLASLNMWVPYGGVCSTDDKCDSRQNEEVMKR